MKWQRCQQFHLQQNAQSYVPKKDMKGKVASRIRTIFTAPDRAEAAHVHLLIQVGSAPLSNIMQNLSFRYIHLNPIRAALCATVNDYAWSSYHAYTGKITIPWLYRQKILGRFSQNESKARALLRDVTQQGIGEDRRDEFHSGSHRGQILGDDHFAERVLNASGYAGIMKPHFQVSLW